MRLQAFDIYCLHFLAPTHGEHVVAPGDPLLYILQQVAQLIRETHLIKKRSGPPVLWLPEEGEGPSSSLTAFFFFFLIELAYFEI